MEVIPAIDIMQGKCVRLLKGKAEKKTVYGEPIDFAKKWKADGAKLLHVVDLDAAMGEGSNRQKILQMIRAGINVEVAGGIRTVKAAEEWVSTGARRIVIGTVAAEGPELAGRMVDSLGRKAWIAVDCRKKEVVSRGWVAGTGTSPKNLALLAEEWGAGGLIVTDVDRDGSMSAPNLSLTAEVIAATRLPVIVSGGISSVNDCIEARDVGASGVILGKALYEGRVSLKEVMRNVG